MNRERKSIIPQPQKANETSFKSGDKAAEFWDFDKASIFYDNALLIAKDCRTLTDIAIQVGEYTSLFDYLLIKFPKLEPKKRQILEILKNNIISKAFDNKINVVMSIFVLKNHHNMTDKTEVEQSIKPERPNISFDE